MSSVVSFILYTRFHLKIWSRHTPELNLCAAYWVLGGIRPLMYLSAIDENLRFMLYHIIRPGCMGKLARRRKRRQKKKGKKREKEKTMEKTGALGMYFFFCGNE